MTRIVSKVILGAALLALAACGPNPSDSAFMNRGGPESLIDVSSEAVSLNIATKKDVDALNQWIAGDAPTRAELQCDVSSKSCKDALKVLEKKGVQVSTMPSANNTVTLVYERILARDCNQRYREQGGHMYNAPHAALGCSVAANIVQHVSDKSVFVNPEISDVPRSNTAVDALGRMNAQRTAPSSYGVEKSLAGNAKTED